MRRWSAFAVVALVAACGGGTTDRAEQVTDAADEAGLGADVQEFLALLVQGADATYSASYDARSASGDTQFIVVQRPPDRRVDVLAPDGGLDSTILVDGTTYHCQRAGTGTGTAADWQCEDLGEPTGTSDDPFDPEALEAAADALRDAGEQYELAVEDRTIADVAATCLVTTLKPGNEGDTTLGREGTLCLSAEGVVVLLERPGETMTATRYDTTVAADAFTLPAEP